MKVSNQWNNLRTIMCCVLRMIEYCQSPQSSYISTAFQPTSPPPPLSILSLSVAATYTQQSSTNNNICKLLNKHTPASPLSHNTRRSNNDCNYPAGSPGYRPGLLWSLHLLRARGSGSTVSRQWVYLIYYFVISMQSEWFGQFTRGNN